MAMTYGNGKTYNSGETYSSPEHAITEYFSRIDQRVGRFVQAEISHTGSAFTIYALRLHGKVQGPSTNTLYQAFTDRSTPERVAVMISHSSPSSFVIHHIRLNINMRTGHQPA